MSARRHVGRIARQLQRQTFPALSGRAEERTVIDLSESGDAIADLTAQVEACHVEIERLREQLAAKDALLGEARSALRSARTALQDHLAMLNP